MMETRAVAPATATALIATVGAGAAGWVIAIPRMSGMDMGVATTLGSFPFFLSVWLPMMAAMMLPGVAPSVLRVAAAGRTGVDVVRHVGSYLAMWAVLGVVVFTLYRPHSTTSAGAITIAAGLYELTPLKRRFRLMCQDRAGSGWELGFCCIGSTAGLMLVMLAFGAMSLTWMALAAAAVLLQKLLPPKAVVDVPFAIAILTIGVMQLAH
jgi:predicted metal-binding membrane protein